MQKKKDLSKTQISHWIVNCDWGRKGPCVNDNSTDEATAALIKSALEQIDCIRCH